MKSDNSESGNQTEIKPDVSKSNQAVGAGTPARQDDSAPAPPANLNSVHSDALNSVHADAADPQKAFMDFLLGYFPEPHHRTIRRVIGASILLAAILGTLQSLGAFAATVSQQAFEIVSGAWIDPPPVRPETVEVNQTADRLESLAQVLSEKDKKNLEKLLVDLPKERKLLRMLCEATLAINSFDYRKVISLLPEDIDTLYPNSLKEELLQGYKLRGLSLLQLRRLSSSLASYEKALNISSKDWAANSGKASCLVQQKKYEAAIEIYNTLLLPDNNLEKGKEYKFHLANAKNSRGIAYMRLAKFEPASDDFAKAHKLISKIESPDYKILVTKGVILNSQGTALIEWAEHQGGNETRMREMLNRAIDLLTEGIAVFKMEIETDLATVNRSDLAMLYTNRSIANAKLKNFEDADRDIVAAIEIRKRLIEEGHDEFYASLLNAFYNRAIIARDSGNPPTLITACTSGIDTCVDINRTAMKSVALMTLCDLHSLRSFARRDDGDLEGTIEDSECILSLCEQLDLRKTELRSIYVTAANNIAWRCAASVDERFRDGERAVALATKACELDQKSDWGVIDTLACAYAERGYRHGQLGNAEAERKDFEVAVATEKLALKTLKNETIAKTDDGRDEERTAEEYLADLKYVEDMIELFRNKQPYRDQPVPEPVPTDQLTPPEPTDEMDQETHRLPGNRQSGIYHPLAILPASERSWQYRQR